MQYYKTRVVELAKNLELYAQLKQEYVAAGIEPLLQQTEQSLERLTEAMKQLTDNAILAEQEPNDLVAIKKLRPAGIRKFDHSLADMNYHERLSGALLGRMAGCTLGAPVELWSIERMQALAEETNNEFPPTDYFTYVPEMTKERYHSRHGQIKRYTREQLDGVPVDDDIVYTLLGLLIVEEYGYNFSIADVGKAWLKYIPFACTAEDVTLKNLQAGIDAERCAEVNNPYCEWIGADIRADAWGYIAPGRPELAAELAYKDAFISHRRQGIYGEMFFAATIAAAFAVDDPIEAVKIGLTEIPADCRLAQAIKWTLEIAPEIKDYQAARAAIDEKFPGMNPVHTINNACLTILGLTIGGKDFTKVIGETVAMGLDNDCTAATAGSIIGAIIGKKALPEHWYKNFNNKVYSYLNGQPEFSIEDLLNRFTIQAEQLTNKPLLYLINNQLTSKEEKICQIA